MGVWLVIIVFRQGCCPYTSKGGTAVTVLKDTPIILEDVGSDRVSKSRQLFQGFAASANFNPSKT